MYTFTQKIRVRYAETDKMGFVYYGNYSTYYEVARVESLRSLGITYREMEEEGILLPVVENFSKYIAPAYYDEDLRIELSIPQKPGRKIEFFYDIYNENDKLIHKGRTILVFVSRESGRPCDPPENILKTLDPYYSDEN